MRKRKCRGEKTTLEWPKLVSLRPFSPLIGGILGLKKVVLDFRLGHRECPNQKIRFKGFNFKILTKAQLQNFWPNFIFNDNIIQVLSEWVYIGMKMIPLWSNRNCMRSANLNIFYIWVESWQHVHSIWKCGHWYWTSHLAGMQITTLTRLTYNCAHLRSTKESDSVKKKKLCENLFVWKFFWVKICWVNIFWVNIFFLVKIFGWKFFWVKILGEIFVGDIFLGEHFF